MDTGTFLVNSYFTLDLKKETINKICLLKDSHWKYGIDSQINWFNKNIKKKKHINGIALIIPLK